MKTQQIITILAIIGALVMLGFVLRVTFALLGPLLLIGLGYIAYRMFAKKGEGR